MAVFRVAQKPWSGALHVLNVIVAVFSSMSISSCALYQFVCTEQEAPDNSEADRSQQNCDSMPPIWHLDFCKICLPPV